MRFLRNFIANLGKRRYAQVHDVRVEYSRYPAKEIWEKESDQGEMSQSLNGESNSWRSASLARREYDPGHASERTFHLARHLNKALMAVSYAQTMFPHINPGTL
jgi:hypothetical protein